jgi:hypothetical protein
MQLAPLISMGCSVSAVEFEINGKRGELRADRAMLHYFYIY